MSEFVEMVCPRCGAPLHGQGERFTCDHCGARLLLQRSTPTGVDRKGIQTVNGVSLVPYSYHDPQASLEAFSLLVPQGWSVSGGVEWIPSRPAAPVSIHLLLQSPDGVTALEGFPTQYFTWTTNPMIMMTKPRGSLYFGYEVQQPLSARDSLRQYFLPRFRNFQGLSVLEESPAPDLLQHALKNQPSPNQGGQYYNDTIRARIGYTLNGKAIAEKIFVVAEVTRVVSPGLMGSVDSYFWSLGFGSSLRSSPEQVDSYEELYRAVIASLKVNPSWGAFVQQVSSGLVNNTIRGIQQIGELSRQISRNADEMRESSMRGWQERSAIYDRLNERFDQHIRGVDPYFDPNTGGSVELPAGYTQAWSTPLGEYIVSDDPNFNPNIGSTQNWTPLEPQK